jgi:hypothetical protein
MLPGMSDAAAGIAPTTGGGLARGALVAYRWVLTVFLLAGVVQFFLAGFGVWGGGIGPHRMLGFSMGAVAAVVVVLALLARVGTRDVLLSVLLLLLVGGGQSLLAGLGEDGGSAVWGGLHAVDGLAILGLAGFLHGAAIRRTRVDRPGSSPVSPR